MPKPSAASSMFLMFLISNPAMSLSLREEQSRTSAGAYRRRPDATQPLSRCRALQRFRELGELVLVGECQLDAAASNLGMEPGQVFESGPHTLGKCGVDRRRARARLPLRARPLRPLLGSANGEAPLHDLAR